jgi:hypothetical protein
MKKGEPKYKKFVFETKSVQVDKELNRLRKILRGVSWGTVTQ